MSNKNEKTPQPLFNVEEIFVDIEAIEEGRWVALGADFPGVEVLVRGLSSKPAKAYHEMMERTYPRNERLANGQLTANAREVILKNTIENHCILDWRGIGSGGKELPFSKAQLRSFLFEPKARRLAAAFITAITDLELRKTEAQEEVVKN